MRQHTAMPQFSNFALTIVIKDLNNNHYSSKYNGSELKSILKDLEKSKHKKYNDDCINRNSYIGQLIKEPPLNAFNDLDPLKWIQFDELKNIDYSTEHKKVYSAEWIGNQSQQCKKEGEMKHLLVFDKICNNKRPTIKPEVPDLFKQLIMRCWDSNPANRPDANELYATIYKWWKEKDNKDSVLYKQFPRSKEFSRKKIPVRIFPSQPLASKIHPTARYTSQLLKIPSFSKYLASDF
ncbi:6563_t:CDS:2, partial [Racocetra fulgida]